MLHILGHLLRYPSLTYAELRNHNFVVVSTTLYVLYTLRVNSK